MEYSEGLRELLMLGLGGFFPNNEFNCESIYQREYEKTAYCPIGAEKGFVEIHLSKANEIKRAIRRDVNLSTLENHDNYAKLTKYIEFLEGRFAELNEPKIKAVKRLLQPYFNESGERQFCGLVDYIVTGERPTPHPILKPDTDIIAKELHDAIKNIIRLGFKRRSIIKILHSCCGSSSVLNERTLNHKI
jgi:hypothetical protein